MGIQINGQARTISASDGSLSVAVQQLTDVTYINASGIVTATSFRGANVARGGGNDLLFYENDQEVTTNYEITTGKNAMSAGPVGVATGITVTIPSGSTWTIV